MSQVEWKENRTFVGQVVGKLFQGGRLQNIDGIHHVDVMNSVFAQYALRVDISR